MGEHSTVARWPLRVQLGVAQQQQLLLQLVGRRPQVWRRVGGEKAWLIEFAPGFSFVMTLRFSFSWWKAFRQRTLGLHAPQAWSQDPQGLRQVKREMGPPPVTVARHA